MTKKSKLSVNITYDDGTKVKIVINSPNPSNSIRKLFELLGEEYFKGTNFNSLSDFDLPLIQNEKSENFFQKLDKKTFSENPSSDNITNESLTIESNTSGISSIFSNLDNSERTKTYNILVLFRSLPPSWFTSKDIQKLYNERFGINLKLSEVSIYLSRLTSRGFLERVKVGRSFKYKIKEEFITVK